MGEYPHIDSSVFLGKLLVFWETFPFPKTTHAEAKPQSHFLLCVVLKQRNCPRFAKTWFFRKVYFNPDLFRRIYAI